jgi:hypothetical protein
VNSNRNQNVGTEESEFYQIDSEEGLSPEIMNRQRAKGLHDYEGNKENIINNNESPCKKPAGQFGMAIKPVPLDDEPSNEIQMNFWSDSPYEPELAHKQKGIIAHVDELEPLEASSLFESVYILEGKSDEIKMHIQSEMKIYDLEYDIHSKKTLELTKEEKGLILNPTFDDIFNYVKYVAFKSKMEAEIPIISLIYIEKLLRKWGVLVNVHNWRRIVLITLWIGSKIWDDDSLENVHFPKVMPDVSLKDISMLEKNFLNLIDYDVIIKGKEYAKYYFIMTTLGEESKKNPPWRLMNPSTVQKIEGESIRMQKQLQQHYNN